MKVLLLNTYAKSGGASVAARRLCAALRGQSVEAALLVQNAEGLNDPHLVSTQDRWRRWRPMLDALPVWCYRHRRTPHWGNAWLGNTATQAAIQRYAPDVVHLHWINHGMLSVRDVRSISQPLVWTLHDSWAFTGGCHSPQECVTYRKECGGCPELRSGREADLSRRIWKRKRREWERLACTLVVPSQWMADAVKRSSLCSEWRVEVIPNAVDLSVFAPQDRRLARERLGVPASSRMLFFGAHGAEHDWNKGWDIWLEMLPHVAHRFPDAIAMVAGLPRETVVDAALPVRSLGVMAPEDMALAMAAADVTVIPSRMENLPNIAAESLACGTPVVAFAVGGLPEMIQPGETGFLATPHDAEDLARQVGAVLERSEPFHAACIEQAHRRYAPARIAQQHIQLYKELQRTV